MSNGVGNVIPGTRIASQATALLKYFPEPNLAPAPNASGYNYHELTTAQTNSTQLGVRYLRTLGKNATLTAAAGAAEDAVVAEAAEIRIRVSGRASISTTTGPDPRLTM
jgi:hypothetical protein